MSPPHPAVPPAERFRSGVNTLRAVLLVDLVFDLVYLLASYDEPIKQVGHGTRFTITLALLGVLHGGRRWRWALAGWVAIDLALLAAEMRSAGGISLWLLFTIIVAAYVYWACTVGERGMEDAPAEPA